MQWQRNLNHRWTQMENLLETAYVGMSADWSLSNPFPFSTTARMRARACRTCTATFSADALCTGRRGDFPP